MGEAGSAAVAVVSLLEAYLEEQAGRLHGRCGEVAGAAVTVAVNGRPVTVGSSTPLAYEVDQTQYAIGVGPCLAALETGTALYVPDLASDPRWQPYGAQAAALGVRSCVSLPVVIDGSVLAVAKVYSAEIDGLDLAQRQAAEQAATEITGGILLAERLVLQATELDDRAAAMTNRRNIDLAIGVLMGSTGCDADGAFDLLRQQSQHANVKLSETAALLLADRASARAPFTPRTAR